MDVVIYNCFKDIGINPPVHLPIEQYILEKEYLLRSNRQLLVSNLHQKVVFDLDTNQIFKFAVNHFQSTD